MKIIQLKAQNFKNLVAIEINPDGNVVEITGANGAGKSAILDAVFTALTGTRVEDPIRHGEERAEVNIDLGDFKVRRIWTEKGERLEVVNKDGDSKKSPQTFLNGIIGKISFDPLAFVAMTPRAQREILKNLVGLDFEDIQQEYQKVFDSRSAVNTNIKGAVAQLENAEPPDPKTPNNEILFKDELEKLNQLRGKRTDYINSLEDRQGTEEAISYKQQEIKEYLDEIEKLKGQIQEHERLLGHLQASLVQVVLPPEVTESEIIAVEASLTDIEAKNVAIRKANRYRSLVKDSNKLKEEWDGHTEKLKRLEQDKATRIANSQMPIAGLSMSDDAVIFNDIPFSRISTGEQIRVSTAIAMKLNPTVRVILIREGSLLDKNGRQEIYKIAQEKDFMVLMETVDETGDVGVYIQDGSIIKIKGKIVELPTQNREVDQEGKGQTCESKNNAESMEV